MKRESSPAVIRWQFKAPIGKSEVIECPICRGKLHMDQMPESGYVNGVCETPECLNFSLPALDDMRRIAQQAGLQIDFEGLSRGL